jgi:hypothetical protein
MIIMQGAMRAYRTGEVEGEASTSQQQQQSQGEKTLDEIQLSVAYFPLDEQVSNHINFFTRIWLLR